MPREGRHVEFFGPDFARGPVLSGSPPVAAVQVATQLAQLRVPLLRDDDAIETHAEFIRSLADKLFPDYAAGIKLDVGSEVSDEILTQIRVDTGNYTLLRLWLADSKGGGVTATSPTSVTFNSGAVLQTVASNKHYLVIAPSTGVVSATVEYNGDQTWYWAAARQGRAYYSSALNFDA
jgi:hypothetical protein